MTTPEAHPTTLFVRNLKPVTTKADLDGHFGGVGPLRRTVIVTDHSTGLCKGFGFVHYALAEDAKSALNCLNGSMLHGRRITLDFARPRQRGKSDEDGGLAPRAPQQKDKSGKQKGKLKGALAMRTVLLHRKDRGELSEEDARIAFGGDKKPDTVLLVAEGKEARCTFGSWAEAGKAASTAHGRQFDACVEALKGGKSTRLIVRNLPFKVNKDEFRAAFSKYAPVRDLRLEPPRPLKGKTEEVGDNPQGDEGSFVQCAGFGFVEYFLVADAKYAMTKMNGAKIGGRIAAVDLALGKSDYVEKVSREETRDGNQSENIEKTDSEEASDSDSQDGSDSLEIDDEGPEVTLNNSVDGTKNRKHIESLKPRVEPTAPKKAPVSTESEISRTVFVRNLLFETSAPELWEAMEEEFGPVEQAVLVKDRVTGRPRGTAFVRFSCSADAERAVRQAGAGDTSKMRSALSGPQSGGFVLQGRQLMISEAVDRSRVRDIAESAGGNEKKHDPRNLRLTWIGQIKPGTKEAQSLSEADLARRAKSDKEKKTKLSRNPNAFVSDVRLSVRNIPKDFEDHLLKHMFVTAAGDGLLLKGKSSKIGMEKASASSERTNSYRPQPRVTYCKIIRDENRKDKSKGYGFVQFEKHEHALLALHRINNNSKALHDLFEAAPKFLKIDEHRERLLRKQWGGGRRLQVDFAVEDRRIVQVLDKIKEKGKKISQEHKQKQAKEIAEEGRTPKRFSKKKTTTQGKDGAERKLESERANSKSEKRSALKRKRAEETERRERGPKLTLPNRNDSQSANGSQRVQAESALKEKERMKAAAKRKRDWVEMSLAEKPDPKPKKSRRMRNAAEVERDAKLDSLVTAYKRKLSKGAKKAEPTPKGASGPRIQPGPRWFE